MGDLKIYHFLLLNSHFSILDLSLRSLTPFSTYRIPDRIFGPVGPRQPSFEAGDRGDTSGRRAPPEVLPSRSDKCPDRSDPPAPAGRSGGSCPVSLPSPRLRVNPLLP